MAVGPEKDAAAMPMVVLSGMITADTNLLCFDLHTRDLLGDAG